MRVFGLVCQGELWPWLSASLSFFSLPHSLIRSPRRSLTAHASSDYWDQTGENTHTRLLLTSWPEHAHSWLLTSSLMSYRWRRADCRHPEAEERGLTLPRYTHRSLATASPKRCRFLSGLSTTAWSGALWVSERKRECVWGNSAKFWGDFTCQIMTQQTPKSSLSDLLLHTKTLTDSRILAVCQNLVNETLLSLIK